MINNLLCPGSRRVLVENEHGKERTNLTDVIWMPKELCEYDISDSAYRHALWASSVLCDTPLVTILGNAGTGKSVLLEMVYKIHIEDGDVPLVLVPTGVAADNLRGRVGSVYTFHRRFKLDKASWHSYAPFRGEKRSKDFTNHFKPLLGVQTVLIDEIGMTSCNLLDYVLDFVNDYNKYVYGKKVRVILFGDVLQIPPVVNFSNELERQLWEDKYGTNIYFFNSVTYREMEKQTIILNQVRRQDFEWYKEVLNRIREGEPKDVDLSLLNEAEIDFETFKRRHKETGYLYLAYSNNAVAQHNEKEVEAVMEKVRSMDNSDKRVLSVKYGATLSYSKYNLSLEEAVIQEFPALSVVTELCVGMQVMCLSNWYHNPKGDGLNKKQYRTDYFNGNIGIIERFEEWINPDDGDVQILPVVRLPSGEALIHMHHFDKSELERDENGRLVNKQVLSVQQIGCKPAYAITFHKSQSLTLPAVYLDLKSLPSKNGYGANTSSIVYLGLSRVRCFMNLGLNGKLSMDDIKISEEVKEYLSTLEAEKEKENFSLVPAKARGDVIITRVKPVHGAFKRSVKLINKQGFAKE